MARLPLRNEYVILLTFLLRFVVSRRLERNGLTIVVLRGIVRAIVPNCWSDSLYEFVESIF